MKLVDVELLTERLILKPIAMRYKEVIFSEFTEEITTYMYPCPPQDISETEAFISDSIDEMADG